MVNVGTRETVDRKSEKEERERDCKWTQKEFSGTVE
jgi:hypothetical protein